ncbi:MAG: FtsX-like permease family protein [Vicinamibacterales bacterium]
MLTRLLSWLTDAALADAMMSDLTSERRRHARKSPALAALWFWRTAIGLVGHLAATRLRARVSSPLEGAVSLARGRGDLRHAIRSLRRAPWYSIAAVGVIALGMAFATTAFAVVDGVLFKPLPYRDPGELYAAGRIIVRDGDAIPRFLMASAIEVDAWAGAIPEAAFATFNTSGAPLDLSAAERPRVATVDAAFLDVLGMTPLIGGFRPEHFEGPRDIRPALITHRLWQRAFGGDPSIVGRVVTDLEQQRVQVVGILPRDFVFPAVSSRLVPEMLMPLVLDPDERRDLRARSQHVIARLPAAVAETAAEQRLARAAADLERLWPAIPPSAAPARPTQPPDLIPLRSILSPDARDVSWAVFAASAFLMLLACVNVSGLAGTRLQDRRHELAMRRALGGTTGDLLRVLAIESSVIVIAGAACGLLFAHFLLNVTLALMPPGLMFLKPPVIDVRVLGFAVLASAVCVAIVTLWPAWSTRRPQVASALTGTRGASGRARTNARAVLIAAQVALALVMAVAGTLLAGSLLRVWRENPGFNPDNAATLLLNGGEGASAALIHDMVATVRDTPGVAAAGGLSDALLENMRNGSPFEPPAGALSGEASDTGIIEGISVTAGFFDAAGLRAIEGRLPTGAELRRGDPVVAVSERVARQFWPRGSALGQGLRARDRLFTVVGVVPDARYMALDAKPDGAIYSSIAADARPSIRHVLVRFDGDAAVSLPRIVNLLSDRFPMYRVSRAQTLTAALGESIRHRRFQTWLFSSFGAAAVLLAGVGILGVMAMTTGRRTREVGIRVAVGATRREIVRLMMREQLATVAAGLLTGALVASWVVRFLQAYVYELRIYDPGVWLTAIGTILVTAVAGTALPAWRAGRMDPVKALRMD